VSAPETFTGIHDVRLDENFLDHAVFREHGIAPTAHAHALRTPVDQQAHQAREVAVAVGEHEHFLDFLALGPPKHDKSVVDGEADDLIDAQAAKRVVALLIAGQMAFRTGWREGPGQGEKHDALAAENVVAGKVPPFERIGTV
jgi:hypothetical protein